MGALKRVRARELPHAMRFFLGACAILALVILTAQEAEGKGDWLMNTLRNAERRVEEKIQDRDGRVEDGKSEFKPKVSYNFWKDKAIQVGGGESFGRPGRYRSQPRRRRTSNMKDFIYSANERSSADTLMSMGNIEREDAGKLPTRYLQGGATGRDPPRKHGILNPAFRSFPGQFRGKSERQRRQEEANNKAMKEIAELNNIPEEDDDVYDGGITMDED